MILINFNLRNTLVLSLSFFILLYVLVYIYIYTEHNSPTPNNKFIEVNEEKWIVTTSVNYPTQAIKKLAQIKEWKLVVVGDKATPEDWSLPNVIFLSIEDQLNLGYQIVQLLPFKSYARKNIGYLFAIQHGARVIYETDDDNLLIRPVLSMAFDTQENVTQPTLWDSAGYEFINPYPTFGQPTMWPRGYPLSLIGKETNRNFFRHPDKVSVAIQQGLADGDPDVDAVFRLTRKSMGKPIDIRFRGPMDRVILPHGSLSPFNSQNTLFHYRAFWGMYIPSTTTFRTSDIWRGYWAQRLLWEINSHLGFYGSSVYQDRNEHDYLKDYMDEKPLYEDALKFGKFLHSWTPPPRDSHFSDIMLSLSIDMAKQGFWKEKEIPIMKAWIQDLKNIGFQFPERDTSSLSLKHKPNASFKLPCNNIPPQSTSNLLCYVDETPLRYIYAIPYAGLTNQRLDIIMSAMIAAKKQLTLILPRAYLKANQLRSSVPFHEFYDEASFRQNLPEINMVREDELPATMLQTLEKNKSLSLKKWDSWSNFEENKPIRIKVEGQKQIEVFKFFHPYRSFIIGDKEDIMMWERINRALYPALNLFSVQQSIEDKILQFGNRWIAVHQRSGHIYRNWVAYDATPKEQIQIMESKLKLDPSLPVYLFGSGMNQNTIDLYRDRFNTVIVSDEVIENISPMAKAFINFEISRNSAFYISPNRRSSFDSLLYLLSFETVFQENSPRSSVCQTAGTIVNYDFPESIFKETPNCSDPKFTPMIPSHLQRPSEKDSYGTREQFQTKT